MIYFAYGSGIFAGLMVWALACELAAGWVIRQIGGERMSNRHSQYDGPVRGRPDGGNTPLPSTK